MRSLFFLAGALLLTPLTVRAEEVKTVSWFAAHPITRDRVHALCMNNPGEAQRDPNCLNAAAAVARSTINQIPAVSLSQICATVSSEEYRRIVLHCPAGDRR